VLGTAAFSGLGLLLAGTLWAEATLALANLLFLLLLLAGDVIVPLSRFPTGLAGALRLLPITALSDGLRAVLQQGAPLPLGDTVTLAAWAVAAIAAAGLTFHWEQPAPISQLLPPHFVPSLHVVGGLEREVAPRIWRPRTHTVSRLEPKGRRLLPLPLARLD
jgi:hypothetical protein